MDDGWMDGQIDRIDGWMNGWLDRCVWIIGQLGGWWDNGRMDGRIDG